MSIKTVPVPGLVPLAGGVGWEYGVNHVWAERSPDNPRKWIHCFNPRCYSDIRTVSRTTYNTKADALRAGVREATVLFRRKEME